MTISIIIYLKNHDKMTSSDQFYVIDYNKMFSITIKIYHDLLGLSVEIFVQLIHFAQVFAHRWLIVRINNVFFLIDLQRILFITNIVQRKLKYSNKTKLRDIFNDDAFLLKSHYNIILNEHCTSTQGSRSKKWQSNSLTNYQLNQILNSHYQEQTTKFHSGTYQKLKKNYWI